MPSAAEPMMMPVRFKKHWILMSVCIFLIVIGVFASPPKSLAQSFPAGTGITSFNFGIGPGAGSSFYSTFGTGYADSLYYYPPLAGVYSPIDPNLIIYPPTDRTQLPKVEPTATDLISTGQTQQAMDLLLDELITQPDDPERLRLLAVSMAGNGDFVPAANILLAVYQSDPLISVYPLDGSAVFGSRRALRQIIIGAVKDVQKRESPQGWLLVAMLKQAQGQDDVAAKMIQRAQALGLDPSIVRAWPTIGKP
jgi:hypothetical protein